MTTQNAWGGLKDLTPMDKYTFLTGSMYVCWLMTRRCGYYLFEYLTLIFAVILFLMAIYEMFKQIIAHQLWTIRTGHLLFFLFLSTATIVTIWGKCSFIWNCIPFLH